MDKMYSAQDVSNVIAKVEDLAKINAELDYLLRHGSNNEKLIERKRELEGDIRAYRGIVSDMQGDFVKEPEVDTELIALKADYDSVISRYKQRKIELQTIIRSYTNGNSD
jgi:hypothetical protein